MDRMDARRRIDGLMREAIERGRAAERAKGLAALSLVAREYPGNLVAFLWLARCVSRADVRVDRPSASSSRVAP
jgi:hypothetical protein